MNSWKFIGNKIMFLCAQKNLSLQELSHRTGLSPSTLRNIAGGRQIPRLITVKRICDSLEIPLSEFFQTEEMLPTPPENEKTSSNN